MVETLDHYVGQLLEALDELGLRENTLVVFTSDNGGHPHYTSNAPLRGSKWNLYEGGIRVPLIMRWPGTISASRISETPVTSVDFFPTFLELSDPTDAAAPATDSKGNLYIAATANGMQRLLFKAP